MAPLPFALLPEMVVLVTSAVPAVSLKIALPRKAELPANVLLVTLSWPWLEMPPPTWDWLPENVLLFTVSVPSFLRAPPFPPWLPENAQPFTDNVPELSITDRPAAKFLNVNPDIATVTPEFTWNVDGPPSSPLMAREEAPGPLMVRF